MRGSSTSGRWIAAVTLVGALAALSSFAVAGARPSHQGAPAQAEAQTKSRGDAAARPQGAREGRGGPRRELTDQDIDRIIATARDIDPSWGDGLDALRAQDSAALRQRLGSQARMLIGLAMIRDRQPELYRARVEDFRVQRQIRSAVERLQKARADGDAAAESAALAEARQAAGREFELDVKARAYELVAMEKALKDARKRLQTDIADRDARVADVMAAVERGEMPRFGRGGEGGEGGWWRRGEGEGPRPGPAQGPPPERDASP